MRNNRIEIAEDGVTVLKAEFNDGNVIESRVLDAVREMHSDVYEGTMDVLLDGAKVGEVSVDLLVQFFAR